MQLNKLTYACPGYDDGYGTLFVEAEFVEEGKIFYILGIESSPNAMFETRALIMSESSVFDLMGQPGESNKKGLRIVSFEATSKAPEYGSVSADVDDLPNLYQDTKFSMHLISMDNALDELQDMIDEEHALAHFVVFDFMDQAAFDIEWFLDEDKLDQEGIAVFRYVFEKYKHLDELDPNHVVESIFLND